MRLRHGHEHGPEYSTIVALTYEISNGSALDIFRMPRLAVDGKSTLGAQVGF